MDLNELWGKALREIKNNRKATLIWAGAILFLVVEIVVCLKVYSSSKNVSARLLAVNTQMETARSAGLLQVSPTELAGLQSRMFYFKQGFVNTAEISVILNMISDHAEKNKVRVVNINSESSISASGTDPGSRKFTQIPIHVNLEGSYESFAEFLNSLVRSSPKAFAVESYRIQKSKTFGSLDCDMVLSFFSNG